MSKSKLKPFFFFQISWGREYEVLPRFDACFSIKFGEKILTLIQFKTLKIKIQNSICMRAAIKSRPKDVVFYTDSLAWKTV